MTPDLYPMLTPFAEALAFQLRRRPMTRAAFDALELEARTRAFTIAGLARQDLLEAARDVAVAAIEESLTKSEFMDRLGRILDQQGGLFLTPQRMELIAQNNTAISYSAGRWAQAHDPEVLAERPYFQYPTGPHDDSTSDICLALEGFVARHDDPAWSHIWPPNHHDERHFNVRTLTEAQARATGKLYESPPEFQYPVVEGQTILPDPGWDFAPESLLSGLPPEAANLPRGGLPPGEG